MAKSKKTNNALKSKFRTIAEYVFLVIAVLTFNKFILNPAFIPTSSMENTVLAGDLVLTDKISYAGNMLGFLAYQIN